MCIELKTASSSDAAKAFQAWKHTASSPAAAKARGALMPARPYKHRCLFFVRSGVATPGCRCGKTLHCLRSSLAYKAKHHAAALVSRIALLCHSFDCLWLCLHRCLICCMRDRVASKAEQQTRALDKQGRVTMDWAKVTTRRWYAVC